MSAPATRSGYELAAKILETHPEDAIETLLKYGNGAECDWLEFKAGMTLLPENEEKGDRLDDLYWDYLLSIVAMANTRGGAFVIGVNDKTHDAVPLDSCDPRHVIENEGKEAYLRKEVIDRLDRPERKWTTKDRVVWSLPESIAPFLDKRIMPYKGTDVIILLVPPRKLGEEFFVVSKSGLGEFEHLPVRDMGEVGHVKRLTKDREFATHRANREQQLSSPQFGAWWDELDSEQQTAHADESLDEAIRTYHRKLEEDTRRKLRAFIPLDAEGGEADESMDDEFEDPVAISTFDDDDEDWLNSDSRDEPASDGEQVTYEDDDDEGNDGDVEDDGEEEETRVIKIGLTELLEQRERVVLVGEPGAGKTTCLAHFAVQQGKKERSRPHLFAFIALGRWSEGGSVRELIAIRCGISQAQIDTLLEEKRLHLVLDALNECPDRLRPAALENIRLLLRDHPELPVVLSSRKAEGIHLPGFPIFEVQSMDGEHQRLFLERYLHDTEAAGNILDSLSKQPGGGSIAQNPMLLRMVVDVVHAKGNLPSGRATLYRQWLENWYDREEKKAEKAKDTLPWSKEESIRLLSQMAFAGRVEGYRDIPIDLARHSLGDQDTGFLDRLCQGPLLEIEENFVHFRHETIQEYLCAEWLLAKPTALDALAKKDYDTWGMPIAYAAELILPGKLPNELSEAVWEMNPWVAALVAASPSRAMASICEARPDQVLADAIFRKRYLLSEDLHDIFRKEIKEGALFGKGDVPLSYVVHLSENSKEEWTKFECAYILNMPPFPHPIWRPIHKKELRQSKKKLQEKTLNLFVISQNTFFPTAQKFFPEIPFADAVVGWRWFLPEVLSNFFRQSLEKWVMEFTVLPIEFLSILLEQNSKLSGTKGEKRVEEFSFLFGEDFIEKSLRAIPHKPDLWTKPGIMNLLRFASPKGFPIHDAARSVLVQMIQILEGGEELPIFPCIYSSFGWLCNQLDVTDVPLLMPTLSIFGRAVMKRIGFNPGGMCDPFYNDLPTAGSLQFHESDLKDDCKRKDIFAILLNQEFEMKLSHLEWGKQEVTRNNKSFMADIFLYAVFQNENFPVGVRCYKSPKIRKIIRNRQIGSLWLVRLSPVFAGGMYRFHVDDVQPVSQGKHVCDGVTKPSTKIDSNNNGEMREGPISHFLSTASQAICSVFSSPKPANADSHGNRILPNAENNESSNSVKDNTSSFAKANVKPADLIDEHSRKAEFQSSLLAIDSCREKIRHQLEDRVFAFTVVSVLDFGAMLVNPAFSEPVFCHYSVCPKICEALNSPVEAEVTIRYRENKHVWGFIIHQVISISGVPYFPSESTLNDNTVNSSFCNLQQGEKPIEVNQYKENHLTNPAQRQRIESELKGVRWDMDVLTISSDNRYLFFHHPSFPDNVFYPLPKKNKDAFTVGSRWNVTVDVNENKKKGTFGFIARNVQPLDTPSQNGASSDNRNTSQSQSSEITLPIAAPTPTPGTAASRLADLIPSTIHVYIDEAWPGSQSVSKKDTGVIAGVVWMGANPDYKMLPPIPTHLRDSGKTQLKRLLNCEKAFPFAFPIRFSKAFEPNQTKYVELFSNAIVLLLGWVLPRPSTQTKVLIHAEHYGSFKDGMDDTDSYRALLAGATSTMNSDRLSQWSIEKVEWQDKEFGYIPYGDLVGYLFAETPYAKQMALEFNVDRWPGCVPFSVELLPTLRDLDTFDPSGAAGALFRLSDLCGKSQLFRHSLRTVLDSAKQRPELRDAILSRLCDEYEKKDRNLRTIGRIADVFFAVFPDQTFADKPKLRFLRMLASLQKANHDGNPAAAEQGLSSYGASHSEMEKRDLELCVYADLNVAVHFNDRFEFDKAEKLLRQCQESPSFPYLSAHNRGRLLSSLGQSAALQGRYAEADARFIEALDAFSEVDGELEEETDQTRIYRAFAALDARTPNMRSLLEEALTISLDKAVSRPNAIACYPYREHLLAKALWLLKQSDAKASLDLIENYVAKNEQWGTERQHPWELTLLYRGLLSFEKNHDLSIPCFDALEDWFRSVPHGGVLDLIHAFCLVAERLHCGRQLDIGSLESILASVKNTLPATAPTVDALLGIAHGDSLENIAELWSLLPFNYK